MGLRTGIFGHWIRKIKPEERKFVTPKAVIAGKRHYMKYAISLLKAQKPAISDVDKKMGITFNEYCTTFGKSRLR